MANSEYHNEKVRQWRKENRERSLYNNRRSSTRLFINSADKQDIKFVEDLVKARKKAFKNGKK